MVELDRRDLVLAVGTTAAAISAKAKAAGGTPVAKIDVHTHFAPLKFLDFAEKTEGRPFGLSPLYRRRVDRGFSKDIRRSGTCHPSRQIDE